jgi:sporulation protein YqfC
MSENDRNFREKFTAMLSLPKEIVLDLPKITMFGYEQLVIENYKGIIEYDSEKVRINTARGIIKIFGQNLEINTVTNEEILITGRVCNVEFSN